MKLQELKLHEAEGFELKALHRWLGDEARQAYYRNTDSTYDKIVWYVEGVDDEAVATLEVLPDGDNLNVSMRLGDKPSMDMSTMYDGDDPVLKKKLAARKAKEPPDLRRYTVSAKQSVEAAGKEIDKIVGKYLDTMI